MDALHHDAAVVQARNLLQRPGPIPEMRLKNLAKRGATMVIRSASSSTSSSSSETKSCGANDTDGACEKYYSTNNLAIILGVVIPITVALVTCLILHRRHVKKLRKEDAEDKIKSLDYGLEESKTNEKGRGKRAQKVSTHPEMNRSDAIGVVRTDRGLSMDMGAQNPFLLPPGLSGSRESLHSLSRSYNPGEDRYRPTTFIPDDGSIRSPTSLRSRMDDSSSYTGSTLRRFESESVKGLIPSGNRQDRSETPDLRKLGSATRATNTFLLAPQSSDAARDSFVSTTSSNGNVAALRRSNNYLGQFISGGNKDSGKQEKKVATTVTEMEVEVASPIETSRQLPVAAMRDEPNKRQSVYEMSASRNSTLRNESASPAIERPPLLPQLSLDPIIVPEIQVQQPRNVVTQPPSVQPRQHTPSATEHPQTAEQSKVDGQPTVPGIHVKHAQQDDDNASDYYDDDTYSEYETYLDYNDRRSMMGHRPLPPDDPSENPEQRANRIRSFYKEYFDDTDPSKPSQSHANRQQPNYHDGSEEYIDDYYGSYGHPQAGSRGPSMAGRADGRHRATISNGSYMSGQVAGATGPRGRPAPKKKAPVPKALINLPTPHKLKDDDFLPNAADYAPPQMYKNQRSGTPDSLRGGSQPYSPQVRAHVPLVSSFDDLAVMPSPHQLRKSGNFTNLDFAPPGIGRFRGGDGSSDGGSIRSNRSGMSQLHLENIRKGAYRVSRIPKEVAGTRDDFAVSLKPKWDIGR